MDKVLVSIAILLSLMLIICMPSAEARKTVKECKGGREFWGCESATKECQRLCENKHFRNKKSKSCNKSCHQACVCVPGFLREGEDGECVPDTECSSA